MLQSVGQAWSTRSEIVSSLEEIAVLCLTWPFSFRLCVFSTASFHIQNQFTPFSNTKLHEIMKCIDPQKKKVHISHAV